MKKLFFIFAVALSTVVNAQCYTSLTQSQNKLLDKYGIDYTGLQTRYIMSTNQIDLISDLPTKTGMIKSYTKFINWNSGQMQIMPDTNIIIGTGLDYIKDKILTEEAEPLRWLFNELNNILQVYHSDINNDGIKSIEIVEYHMLGDRNCTRVCHMLFIEDMNGIWSTFSSDDNDITLDCPFCTVP
jgi:hypothetical protein